MTRISQDVLTVFAGGFVGSFCRLQISLWIYAYYAGSANALMTAMLATLSVNVVGSFVLGALWALHQQERLTKRLWQFFGIGLCGAFTTFSALSLEALISFKLQQYDLLLALLGGSVVVCVIVASIGFYVIERGLLPKKPAETPDTKSVIDDKKHTHKAHK